MNDHQVRFYIDTKSVSLLVSIPEEWNDKLSAVKSKLTDCRTKLKGLDGKQNLDPRYVEQEKKRLTGVIEGLANYELKLKEEAFWYEGFRLHKASLHCVTSNVTFERAKQVANGHLKEFEDQVHRMAVQVVISDGTGHVVGRKTVKASTEQAKTMLKQKDIDRHNPDWSDTDVDRLDDRNYTVWSAQTYESVLDNYGSMY
jgi:hypothetical protein